MWGESERDREKHREENWTIGHQEGKRRAGRQGKGGGEGAGHEGGR